MTLGLENIIERIAQRVADETVKAAEKRLADLAERLVDSSELVDVHEAARLLSTTSQAIHKRVQRGTLEAVRKGGRIKFRRSDIVGGHK